MPDRLTKPLPFARRDGTHHPHGKNHRLAVSPKSRRNALAQPTPNTSKLLSTCRSLVCRPAPGRSTRSSTNTTTGPRLRRRRASSACISARTSGAIAGNIGLLGVGRSGGLCAPGARLLGAAHRLGHDRLPNVDEPRSKHDQVLTGGLWLGLPLTPTIIYRALGVPGCLDPLNYKSRIR
jgi:hypothetical protein